MNYKVTLWKTDEEWQFYLRSTAIEFIETHSEHLGVSEDDFDLQEIVPCRGCNKEADERHDAYGISTGYWCDDCYENNYPYRKDQYDYEAYGERLDDDY